VDRIEWNGIGSVTSSRLFHLRGTLMSPPGDPSFCRSVSFCQHLRFRLGLGLGQRLCLFVFIVSLALWLISWRLGFFH